MPKRRRNQPGCRLDASAAMAATHRGRRPLEVRDRLTRRPIMRVANRATNVRVAQGEYDADALRRRERQIKPGHPDRARGVAQRRAVARIQPGEHATQRVAVNPARETERRRRRADPHSARFCAAGVVLLNAATDALDRVDAHLCLVEVVLGLAGRELADRKHREGTAAESGPRAIRFRRPRPEDARRRTPGAGCVCIRLWLGVAGARSRRDSLGMARLEG